MKCPICRKLVDKIDEELDNLSVIAIDKKNNTISGTREPKVDQYICPNLHTFFLPPWCNDEED